MDTNANACESVPKSILRLTSDIRHHYRVSSRWPDHELQPAGCGRIINVKTVLWYKYTLGLTWLQRTSRLQSPSSVLVEAHSSRLHCNTPPLTSPLMRLGTVNSLPRCFFSLPGCLLPTHGPAPCGSATHFTLAAPINLIRPSAAHFCIFFLKRLRPLRSALDTVIIGNSADFISKAKLGW